MKKPIVYVDHAGATPIDPLVLEEMQRFYKEGLFGNPSSFHMLGKQAADALSEARSRAAHVIHAHADEVIFTSGGTESDNLAILGYARKHKDKGNHVITTTTEHKAVLQAMQKLETEGFEVTYVKVDEFGQVDPKDVAAAIKKETILISVIFANNEIGTINPIEGIVKAARKNENASLYLAIHTDACQATPYLELNAQRLGVDLMTINSSKCFGPKGVGLLYKKRGIKIDALQFGGYQEGGARPGTENVIGILGFVKALEICEEMRDKESTRLTKMRDAFIQEVKKRVPKVRLNGHPDERLPNNANLSFMNIEGEALLLHLDDKGIYASTGSACTSKSLDPSHVILALGLPYEVAHGSIRFTFGRETSKKDLKYIAKVLPDIVAKLRRISPVDVDEKYYK